MIARMTIVAFVLFLPLFVGHGRGGIPPQIKKPAPVPRQYYEGLVYRENANGGWNGTQDPINLSLPRRWGQQVVCSLVFTSRDDYQELERFLNTRVRVYGYVVQRGAYPYVVYESVLPFDEKAGDDENAMP